MSRHEIIAFLARAALLGLVGIALFVAVLLIPAEIMASRVGQQHPGQGGRPSHSSPPIKQITSRF